MRIDRFPSTHATWIDSQLAILDERGQTADPAGDGRAAAALSALQRHVMDRYAMAITAYARAGALRAVAEPDDLVSGFFAGPLARPDFFRRWRRSDMPLRRWIMNAVSLHCKGIRRDRLRERARGSGARDHVPLQDMDAGSGDASRAFDRAWALALVGEAYARIQGELQERGRGDDDVILRLHVIDGRPYAEIADALGISRADCLNAVRRVSGRVREAIDDLLREEGYSGSALEDAAAELRSLVSPP